MFSRRKWLSVFACLPGLAFLSTPVQATANRWVRIRMPSGASTFAELEVWLDKLPNRQEKGSPTAVCGQTGEKYVELRSRHWARPGDEAFAERAVVAEMQRGICELFTDRVNGVVYWRIPLETEIIARPQIVAYREDGLDFDLIFDRRCVKDHNWIEVSGYCRLAVSKDSYTGTGLKQHA